MITNQLAEEIVELTMVKLNYNLNVMDANGIILASGEKERIGKIHKGAAFVANSGETLQITDKDLEDWQGTKQGINMPIYFQKNLVGVIGITGNPEELQEVAKLVQLTTEIMVHQALITSQVEWKRKTKELIFEELTWSNSISSVMKERLSLLGFENTSPFTTILIKSDEFLPSSRRVIELLEGQFNKESILVGHSKLNKLFILLSGMDEMTVKRKVLRILAILKNTPSAKIGVGHSVNSLENIRYSYETAKNALKFGNKEQQLILFEDVEFMSLLKRKPSIETERFSKRVLNDLNKLLIDTLSLFFEHNQNISRSAEALNIHRHTMAYRLRKIQEITGYNPSNFQDALLLQVAILLLS